MTARLRSNSPAKSCCCGDTAGPSGSKRSACRLRSCHNGGLCYEGWRGDIKCVCRNGFVGPRCRDRVDPCSSHPCLNDGRCLPRKRRAGRSRRQQRLKRRRHRWRPYRCICTNGYRGDYCQIGPGACASHPCVGGSVCKEVVGGYGYACKSTILFNSSVICVCFDFAIYLLLLPFWRIKMYA